MDSIYNELDPHHKLKLPIQPKHNVNAFMEDFLHDWRYKDGWLHYFSRVVGQGVWLLIEYAENNPYDRE